MNGVGGRACLLLTGLLTWESGSAEEEAIPRPYPETRYVAMWEGNLFRPEVEAKPNVVEPSFAEHLTLLGITEVGGETVVTLRDRRKAVAFDLREGERMEGLIVVDVLVELDPWLTRVRLQRGTETAAVGYERDKSSLMKRSGEERPAAAAAVSAFHEEERDPVPTTQRRLLPLQVEGTAVVASGSP